MQESDKDQQCGDCNADGSPDGQLLEPGLAVLALLLGVVVVGLHLLLGLELDQDHLAGIAEDVIGALRSCPGEDPYSGHQHTYDEERVADDDRDPHPAGGIEESLQDCSHKDKCQCDCTVYQMLY